MENVTTKAAWWRRRPSPRRFALTTVLSLGLGGAALAAGSTYIENVVPVQTAVDIAARPRGTPRTGRAPTPPEVKPRGSVLETPGLIAFGADQERMNILVLGIDYDYTNSDQPTSKTARSDSTMVVSLDSRGSLLNVVSLPRDSRVEMWPAGGYDKLNAAYAYGGMPLAKSTVTHFLGTPMDHYIVVNVDAASKMIDALGGVDVYVEKKMDYDDNWGHLHVHLKKGLQHLNGAQTIGYCRYRHDDESDRGRMRRQQQVVSILLGKLHNPTIAADVPKLASIIKKSVETDLRTAQLLDLARLYLSFDRKNMKTAQLAGADALINDIWYLQPDEAKNRQIVRNLLKDPKDLAIEDTRVEVLNGTGKAGAARAVADALEAKGFKVVRVGLADRANYTGTKIVDRLRNRHVRSRLLQTLAQAKVQEAGAKKDVDITVIVGRKS